MPQLGRVNKIPMLTGNVTIGDKITNRSGQRGLFSLVKMFGFWMGSC